MKKFIYLPINFIKGRLYWQFFLSLLLNLLLVVFSGVLISQLFWADNLNKRLISNEKKLHTFLVEYWSNFYKKNKSFPAAFDEDFQNYHQKNILFFLDKSRLNIALRAEALNDIILRNEQKIPIFAINRNNLPASADASYYQINGQQQPFISDGANSQAQTTKAYDQQYQSNYVDSSYDVEHGNNYGAEQKGKGGKVNSRRGYNEIRGLRYKDDDHDDDHDDDYDDDHDDDRDDDYDDTGLAAYFDIFEDHDQHAIFRGDVVRQIYEKRLSNYHLVDRQLLYKGQVVGWLTLPSFTQEAKTLGHYASFIFSSWWSIIGLMLLITSLISFGLSKWILSPIISINKGLIALERKDFSVRVNSDRQDELGKLARSFNLMAQQMEEFVRSKKLWVASISHEIKTPLTILRAEIEAMLDGIRPIDKRNLSSVYKELVDLTNLSIELQEISINDQDFRVNNQQLLNPDNLLKEQLQKYSYLFSKKGLEIQNKIQQSESLVFANKDLLLRAIAKILENCLAHSSPGLVVVSSYLQEGYWYCQISDSGPGLVGDNYDKIFDYFFRDTNASNLFRGAGLGLAICRTIMQMHNGKIYSEKSDRGGLSVIMCLPIYNEQ